MLSDQHPRYHDSHIKVDFVQPVLFDGYDAWLAIGNKRHNVRYEHLISHTKVSLSRKNILYTMAPKKF